MEYFDANLTPSPTPDSPDRQRQQLPSTPKAKKRSTTLQTPTPTKVTKSAQKTPRTPSSGRVINQSPRPTKLSEIQEYDRVVLDGRAAKPPIPWKECLVLYREAGGIITSVDNLQKKRYPLLLALGQELTNEEIEALRKSEAVIAAEIDNEKAAAIAELERQKWGRVAAHLKSTLTEKDFKPQFLQKTFKELRKSGF